MEKINFTNGQAPAINGANLNQLQTNVEDEFNAQRTGWYEITSTFTYSSWNDNTKTAVISSGDNLTNVLSVGMKVKFTQNSTKYGIITAISNSAITLFMGTDYVLEDTNISSFCFSTLKAPFGFPMNTEKWTLELKKTTNTIIAAPTKSVWYMGDDYILTVPVGLWEITYNLKVQFKPASQVYSTVDLSTSPSESTNLGMTFSNVFTTNAIYGYWASRSKIFNVEEETQYHLIFKNDTDYTNLYFVGAESVPATITARCLYL